MIQTLFVRLTIVMITWHFPNVELYVHSSSNYSELAVVVLKLFSSIALHFYYITTDHKLKK